jgi:pyruvate, water dikinase
MKQNLEAKSKELPESVNGQIANPGYGVGEAYIVRGLSNPKKVDMRGKVLISHYSCPEVAILAYEASAIVTDVGGIMSHLGVISRELRIPCIVATENATKYFRNGQLIQVDAEGNLGGTGVVQIRKN